MSNRTCSILSCPNSAIKTRSRNARIFQVPKSEYYGGQWREWIKVQNLPSICNRKVLSLCDRHFTKDCILPNNRIAAGAVPTISEKALASTSTVPSSPDMTSITLKDILDTCPGVLKCNASPLTKIKQISKATPSVRVHDTSDCTTKKENCNGVVETGIDSPTSASLIHMAPTGENCSSEVPTCAEQMLNRSHEPASELRLSDALGDMCSVESRLQNSGLPFESNYSMSSTIYNDTNEMPNYQQKKALKRYLGELTPADFDTPNRARRHLGIAKRAYERVKRKLINERKKIYRMQKKVKTLTDLVKHLKGGKEMPFDDSALVLQDDGDQFDLFGRVVAVKLRALAERAPEQAALTQRLLSDALFYGQLEALARDASVEPRTRQLPPHLYRRAPGGTSKAAAT